MANDPGILSQLHRNAVAIISLIVALSSLSYNAWRNELTEENRNQRFAAFQVLVKLNEFQQVIFHHHYDKDASDKGNPRTAWAYVLTLKDLALVLNAPLPAEAERLLAVWSANWETLQDSAASRDAILAQLDSMREATLALLVSLR